MSKIKVLVVGAGGVIGQHMMVDVPERVDAVFTRRTGDGVLYKSLDLCEHGWRDVLDDFNPDVVVNLAGESNVDTVEAHPEEAYPVNVMGAARLRGWCDEKEKYLIHISSQIVLDPVNEYGKQKVLAEEMVRRGGKWTIVRPTFVLGIRPFPGIGRKNPAEHILEGHETASVNDRFFSVSFAWDVASYLWGLVVVNRPVRTEMYVGNPDRMTRLSVANKLGVYPKAITHDSLNIAPRPVNTVYQSGSWYETDLQTGMARLEMEFGQRSLDSAGYRAKEIAAFLGKPWQECLDKINTGFMALHAGVAEDFRKMSPVTDSELTTWYRVTEAYIWELTAYHLDKGFNYTGMCKGIVEAMKSKGVKTVLCLGDGIGSLTIAMKIAGLSPWYHDLFGSRTADFAYSRFDMRFGLGNCEDTLTDSFDPPNPGREFDAVVSLDFLEHVPNVEEWVRSIYANLKPGGWFMAQNAFNCGSGPEGSIPMHLVCNDRFEKDWDPLLDTIGFVRESNNWYRKPE